MSPPHCTSALICATLPIEQGRRLAPTDRLRRVVPTRSSRPPSDWQPAVDRSDQDVRISVAPVRTGDAGRRWPPDQDGQRVPGAGSTPSTR